MAAITLNMGYLKSIPGILKIVEFKRLRRYINMDEPQTKNLILKSMIRGLKWFLLLLGFSCMSDCCQSYYNYHSDSKVSFFIAVTVIGWLIVIALFVFFFLNLIEQVKQVNWKLTNMFTSIVLAVLLLICSSLMAERADYYSIWKHYLLANRIWNTMVAGVVFGFFSMIAFVVDAFFQFMAGVSAGNGGESQGPGVKVSNTQNA